MNFESYHTPQGAFSDRCAVIHLVPANYTDAGKLMGMFPIRNTIEALVLCAPLIYLGLAFLPFEITTRIILTMVAVVPTGGFALIGINDDCLTRFIGNWWRWRKSRRVLTFRGSPDQKERREAQWT